MAIKPGKRRSNSKLGAMHEKGSAAGKKPNDVAPGQKWWAMPDEQVPGALMSTIAHIHKNQSAMDQESMVISRLYGGRLPGSSFGVPQQHAVRGVHPSLSGRLTYNLIAIVVDALVSKITKDNIAVQFVTQGGNYRQQRRAKKLSQFADGITYETKMDEIGPEVFRDACLTPCGIVHTYADWSSKRVVSERVMANELFVDYADGFYGNPTQMHRVKMVDRERLLDAWGDDPKIAEAIKNCRDTGPLGFGGEFQGLSDLVAVGESWHLPSGLDDNGDPTDDGRHVLYISNCVLTPPEERKWTKTRFPFSVFRWKRDTEGWHGIPLGRDLVGCQVETNHLLIMMQRAFRMMAAFRIAVENGTVPDQHFQDKIGTILHVPRGGMTPQFLTPPAMNEQYFQWLDKIKERAFEIARLSQLSAVGQKPAGLDSGEAQRVYHDIESEGFSTTQKAYEEFRLDVVRQQVDCVRDIFEKTKSYPLRSPVSSTTLPGLRFLRKIDWKEVRMDEEEYVLRPFSTSALPKTVGGKIATVQDMMRAGIIDAETGRKLLDLPDLQSVMSFMGAMEDWIMSKLDLIVDKGEPQEVDPLMNLQMAKKLAVQEYALGGANGMEEEKMDTLNAWLAQCDDLLNQATMAAAAGAQPDGAGAPAGGPAGGQPGGASPMGVGAPAPVSPMLPPSGMQGAA